MFYLVSTNHKLYIYYIRGSIKIVSCFRENYLLEFVQLYHNIIENWVWIWVISFNVEACNYGQNFIYLRSYFIVPRRRKKNVFFVTYQPAVHFNIRKFIWNSKIYQAFLQPPTLVSLPQTLLIAFSEPWLRVHWCGWRMCGSSSGDSLHPSEPESEMDAAIVFTL